jgi:hypothetical protein
MIFGDECNNRYVLSINKFSGKGELENKHIILKIFIL